MAHCSARPPPRTHAQLTSPLQEMASCSSNHLQGARHTATWTCCWQSTVTSVACATGSIASLATSSPAPSPPTRKGLNEKAKDARKHDPLAPISEFIDFTPLPNEVGHPVDTVSLCQADTGNKTNCAWSPKLVEKAAKVYYHGVSSKAASKH